MLLLVSRPCLLPIRPTRIRRWVGGVVLERNKAPLTHSQVLMSPYFLQHLGRANFISYFGS